MSVHEKPVGGSVEWYTPPELFEKLGLRFDLDPASPNPPVPWVPADRFYWEDGHLLPWGGRVWLNPPYGPAAIPFIDRMIQHDHGMLLLPARTETRAFQRAARAAEHVIFLRDRLHFVRPDGHQSRSSFASVLMAFGPHDLEMRWQVARADLGWTVFRPLPALDDPGRIASEPQISSGWPLPSPDQEWVRGGVGE